MNLNPNISLLCEWLGKNIKDSKSKNYFKGDNKVLFAEKIVPTFPAKAFQNFQYIFDCFNEIIGLLKDHKPK